MINYHTVCPQSETGWQKSAGPLIWACSLTVGGGGGGFTHGWEEPSSLSAFLLSCVKFYKRVSQNPQGVYPTITVFSCISWTGPLLPTGATVTHRWKVWSHQLTLRQRLRLGSRAAHDPLKHSVASVCHWYLLPVTLATLSASALKSHCNAFWRELFNRIFTWLII